MELRDFLELFGVSSVDMALQLGVNEVTFSHWVSGEYYPKPENVRSIRLATRGLVTANDLQMTWQRWHGLPL